MSSPEILGSVIAALLTLSTFLLAAMKIIITPLNELNSSVKQLNWMLQEVLKDQGEAAATIKDHEGRITTLEYAVGEKMGRRSTDREA